jgi:lipopolysaccharide transport system ATP-binding protein
MNDEVLIKVENVSKKFCKDLRTSLKYGVQDLASEIFGRKHSDELRENEFWAVKDVSFEVRRGECLGLIGRNGAGKSTLLKMLNGLIKPDKGRIEMRGKVGALIALGAGFNPILTGRENIYVYASVLGIRKEETKNKLKEIIEFSEISEFIDSPVQTYSSGMIVRLGFSIAVHLEPDILLLDEILAVGDMGFALKCYNKMDEILQNSAIIFVSHSMPQISRMCSHLTVMRNGESIFNGSNVAKGINLYYDLYDFKENKIFKTEVAELEEIYLSSNNKKSINNEIFEINQGDSFEVHIKIKTFRPVVNPHIFLNFINKEQRAFAEVYNFREFISITKIDHSLHVTAFFTDTQITQGIYSIQLGLFENINNNRKHLLRIQSAIYFKVYSDRHAFVPIQFEPRWKIF